VKGRAWLSPRPGILVEEVSMRIDGPVVIALDGAEHSATTLEWGLAEATLRGADVVLARAYQEPFETPGAGWYPLDGGFGLELEAKGYLADQLEHESARHPALKIEARVLHGAAVPELRRLSEQAQLLVVGAGGPAGRARIGSVSTHLAAHARCPVAVVRGADDGAPDVPVVVGVDGSASSLTAADVAVREAALRKAPLVVLHARERIADLYTRGMPVVALGADAPVDADDASQQPANEVVASLRRENPDLDVRLEVVYADPVLALVDPERAARVVVVGSRGLGAFRGMLIGAVSREVVRNATATVLVIHDNDTD
jgi:nucleotide-binding universal stress UspA family protein